MGWEKEGLGCKKILKAYPNWGFNEHGLRDAVERVKKYGSLERQAGSGGKGHEVRTEAVVESARAYMDANPEATAGDLRRELGLTDGTCRRVLKEDLQLKLLRK